MHDVGADDGQPVGGARFDQPLDERWPRRQARHDRAEQDAYAHAGVGQLAGRAKALPGGRHPRFQIRAHGFVDARQADVDGAALDRGQLRQQIGVPHHQRAFRDQADGRAMFEQRPSARRASL
jgi:hypothetical protein